MRILSLALLAAAVTARGPCTSTVTTVKSLPDGGFRRTITKINDKIEKKTIINYYADGAKDWDVKIKKLQQKEEEKPKKPEEKPKKPEVKPKKPEEKPKKPDNTPAKCTPKKTVGQCGMCQSSDQCAEGFCCPYMKKCVATSRTPCQYPIASCRGSSCKNKDYPSKWGAPTCKDEPKKPKKDDTTDSSSGDDIPSNMRMAGETELKAFEMQNRIRQKPKSLVSTVEDQISRFDSSGMFLSRPNRPTLRANEGVKAWKEAADVLRKQNGFEPFEWNDYLALAAEDHCKYQGARGLTGHDGPNGNKPWDRVKKYGQWGGSVGENIAYGESEGDEYMLQLYIDDGVPNRGHRTNILSEKFKITGIASCEHSGFGGELVAVYAGSFKPNDLGRRELDKRAKN